MVYSDVINNNYHLILSKKNKYTKKDFEKILLKGFTEKQALFIVKCTAIFHDTNYSKYIAFYDSIKNKIKRMLI